MADFLCGYCVGIAASLIIVWILVSVLAYSGLFHRVVVRKLSNPVGKLRVAYLYNTGPYRNCGLLFGRVNSVSPHARCMGIYYDDPKTTPESELRYMVGTILSEHDDAVDDELQKRCEDDGFRVIEVPAIVDAIGTDFPFRWMLSVFFAIWRVYPALNGKIKKEGLNARPCFEIYGDGMTNFYMPLSNNDAYYVPEALKNKST
eukprot:XP_792366.1 PREDICTED: testis-expressed sequence 264 protein [Strongylocentrotus purpuratus]